MSHKSVIHLVEDEPLVRMVMREMLSDAGYQVIEAENALESDGNSRRGA